jgi:hypothetical protein
VEKIYYSFSAVDLFIINKLIDSSLIRTLDTADLQSHPDIEYYAYDEPETHTFELSLVRSKNDVIKQEIKNRTDYRSDICTIQNLSEHKYTARCREPFVAEIRDAVLFGPHAIVKTSNGEFPLEAKANIRGRRLGSFDGMFRSTVYFGGLKSIETMFRQTEPDQNIEVATSLLTGRVNDTPAYGHWLLEVVPRVRGIKHYQEQTGRQPTILVNPDIKKWQIELLELVGIETDALQKWQGGATSVRRYVLPMWAKSEWCVSDLEWVRRQIKSSCEYEQHLDRFSPRVFLSREQLDRRRVSNRSELLDALSDYGFETYHPETLSFPEQVALFENAEILIGPSGSSFANIIFSSDMSVVELHPPGPLASIFIELAQVFGHEYYPVFGRSAGGTQTAENSHQDFTVAPDRVTEVLDTVTN